MQLTMLRIILGRIIKRRIPITVFTPETDLDGRDAIALPTRSGACA